MKHPFWIANSLLLFLFLLTLFFIYFSRAPLPEREEIEPSTYAPHKKEEMLTINISKIYEQDLFGTYHKEMAKAPTVEVPKIPEPPKPRVVSPPKLPEPQFVDPLDITLKGIVVVGTQESKNRAIIEDNKTKMEKTYKVGDSIEDAQLIRIFSTKIILLRSNGQQEVLYLREQDAKLDPVYSVIDSWHEVAQETEEDNFVIYKHAFSLRIKNLAQFIDLLGLTTAYKEGESIGCRIGTLERNSLGTQLGLQTGDIITTINAIPTATTADRLRIYKEVMTTQDETPITVTLLRHNQEQTLVFTIEAKQQEKATTTDQEKPSKSDEEKRKLLEERYKLAPTAEEIRKREKQLMLEIGRAPRAPMPQKQSSNETE